MNDVPAEFLVWCEWREEYVAAIDTFDGATDYTSRIEHARIFSGSTWAKIWDRDGYRLMPIGRVNVNARSAC